MTLGVEKREATDRLLSANGVLVVTELYILCRYIGPIVCVSDW